MKTLHPRRMYTLPCRGVQRGGTPSTGSWGGYLPDWGVWGQVGPQRGFLGEAPEAKIAL